LAEKILKAMAAIITLTEELSERVKRVEEAMERVTAHMRDSLK
jgi:hypothetical protein